MTRWLLETQMMVLAKAAKGCAGAIACGLALSASATISKDLVGDSYIVSVNGVAYSVLDVYVKCGASTDIVSSVFGVSAFNSGFTMNSGKSFVQASGSSWAPVSDDASGIDSFVTTGCRDQGSDNSRAGGKAAFLNLQGDTNFSNFNASGASNIFSVAGSAGAGWYPGIGANTSVNPYARAGYYNGAGLVAKCQMTIPGNGIAPGASLNNLFMVGRFVVEAGTAASADTMTLTFAIAGKNNGVTTVTGATNAAYRCNQTLTYASIPPCPADLDGNHLVDTADISVLLLDFGDCQNCAGDLDGNGLVDTADISLLLMDFGACP